MHSILMYFNAKRKRKREPLSTSQIGNSKFLTLNRSLVTIFIVLKKLNVWKNVFFFCTAQFPCVICIGFALFAKEAYVIMF